MLKSAVIGIIGVAIGAVAVDVTLATNSRVDCHMASAATASMPSISELHARARAQDLPDLTVKEPY
jgi:hypothetical protein